MNNPIRFSGITRVMLLGGGELLARLASQLREQGFHVYVVTSERHVDESIRIEQRYQTLEAFMKEHKFDFHVSPNIGTDPILEARITPQTLVFSLGAAWIFKKDFIDRFGGRLLNIHGTELPRNRGGGGFSWQMMMGTRKGVALIHQIDGGLDSGDILKFEEFLYPEALDCPQACIDCYIEKTLLLLKDFMEEIRSEKVFVPAKQQENFSSYWPRLSTIHHGFINWSWSLKDIDCFIRAFDRPYQGASTFMGERRIFLRKCFADHQEGRFHPFQTGLVYRKTKDWLYVAVKEGALVVGEAQDMEGKGVIGSIQVGDRFHTPASRLDEAMSYRAIYTPQGLKESKNT